MGRVRVDEQTKAIALLLHGGSAEQHQPRRLHDLSYLRMAPFAAAVRRVSGGLVAPVLVHNTDGGWVAPSGSGVIQARELIDRLAAAHALPIVLLGHSSGGWVALRAGDSSQVLGSVALAPWIGEQDPKDHLRDKVVRVIHGESDRICSPQRSRDYVEQLQALGADATYLSVPGGHTLLDHPLRWHNLAGQAVTEIVEAEAPA